MHWRGRRVEAVDLGDRLHLVEVAHRADDVVSPVSSSAFAVLRPRPDDVPVITTSFFSPNCAFTAASAADFAAPEPGASSCS